MSSEEYNKIKKDFTKQILVILIPTLLVTFISGFMGVKVAVEVDDQRIKNNKEKIHRNVREIDKLQREDDQIWEYLRENYTSKTRGIEMERDKK